MPNGALRKISDGNSRNDNAACGKIGAFINQVNAQSGKKIDSSDADQWIADAQAILDDLGC